MQLTQGFQYFISGFNLINTKGLRRFVFIPLIINILIFGSSLFFIYDWLTQGFQTINAYLPTWLHWLEWVLWPIAILIILFSYSIVFSILTNFIAAPFNGLLSEKVHLHLTGHNINEDSLADTVKDIPRMLAREWVKLMYYLPKAIGFFCLLWILPFVGQILWILFTSWMFSVQYIDYPYDNHKISFQETRNQLKQKQGLSYGFGLAVLLFTTIPLLNLLVMPVAVCGATKLWVEKFRN